MELNFAYQSQDYIGCDNIMQVWVSIHWRLCKTDYLKKVNIGRLEAVGRVILLGNFFILVMTNVFIGI